MVVVLFRNRPREGRDHAEYGQLGAKLVGIVSQMPGFVSMDVFSGANGESLVMARFENDDAVREWRQQADHVAAQGKRDDFYDRYSVTVCNVVREYGWERS